MSEIVDCIAFIVRKTCWSLYVCAKFVSLRLLDFLGLVFNILACLTIVRLPCMIKLFADMNSMDEWRFIGFLQFMIFLSDIPFIVMGVILVVSTLGLILFPLFARIKKEDIGWDFSSRYHYHYSGFKLRKIIALYFFRMICDILCIPLALLCLCSWRCVIFVRKLKEKGYSWEKWGWRRQCFVQALNLLVDIPCILVGLIVMLTWRGPCLIQDIKDRDEDAKKWDSYRLEVFPAFALIFIDIGCMILFLLTFLTWRGPLMIIALKETENKTQWKVRSIVCQEALLILVDLPCILCALFVFTTVWRIPNLVKNSTKDQCKLRVTCCTEAAMVLVDLACFILAAVIILTLWRVYPLGKDIQKYWAVERKKRSWKMRKAICKHFLFLFIDIPAITLCFLFLITVFRLPKLISKLIQTGDFFTEFAITVYYQIGRLIVDFVFLCLFIVLVVLRPIQSWVHLLEDEEHRKIHLLRHYIQWVPDIIQKRHQMRREMEEVFSSSLKEHNKLREMQIRLSVVNASYLKDLQWIRDKIQKHQLEEEYEYLIHMAQWWEGKRAHKMSRLYACELNFLWHPSQTQHNSNLQKYKNEMLVFEHQVNKQYQAVESYTVPQVPLWSEACGLKTRTRKETQQVLIKCLPHGNFALSLLIFLNLVFIYRGPSLVGKLWRRWYDRRNTVFNSTKEYFLDLLTILRILLLIALLFRAPFLIADITQDIFLKRSWKAVRETAKRYPPYIWEDLFNVFSTVLSWKTIRYTFTAFLFGILMPADLFLTITKTMSSSKCLAFSCTALLYTFFMGFPLLFPYYLVGKLGGSFISLAIGVFAFLLLAVLVAMVIAMMKDEENPIATKPEPYNYIHFNWTNVHVIVFEFVELLQLVAIVFAINDLPMMGASTLKMVSNYLLLDFATFEVKMWITLFLFVSWFLCCSAPVIFEQVLKDLTKGTCGKHVGWTLLLSLFANTLFVTFVESFLRFVSCQYTDCVPNTDNQTLTMNGSNMNSCALAVLDEDPKVTCWEGDHRAVAAAGLLGLVWYTTTAIIFGMRYGDIGHPYQDLKFSLIYNTFINFVKAFMVGVVVLAAPFPNVVFGCLIFATIAAVLFTVVYNKIFHHQPANSFVLKLWRQACFLCGAVAAVAALVAQAQNKQANLVPLIILFGGCGGVLIFSAIISVIRSRRMTPMEETRQQFRDSLRRLKSRLVQNGHMVNSWTKRQSQWERLVKGVREAQEDDSSIPTYPDLVIDPSPGDVAQSSQETPLPSEADALPPPPPYEDLFPNILVPYGTIPPPPPYPGEDISPEGADIEGFSGSDIDGDGDGGGDGDSDVDDNDDFHSDGDGDVDVHGDGDGGVDVHGDGDGDVDVHSDGDGDVDDNDDVHSDGDSDVDVHSDGDVDVHSDGDVDVHGDGDVDVHGDGDVDVHGDGDGDVHGDGSGNIDDDDSGDRDNKADDDRDTEIQETVPELGSYGRRTDFRQLQFTPMCPRPTEVCADSTRLLEQGLRPSEDILVCKYERELERSRRHDPLLALESNGMNLLLLLEQHIHYSAFSFAFISQLRLWRASVRGSNWVGLLHCLQYLENNLNGNFNKPTQLDVSLADTTVQPFTLPRDPDHEKQPEFVAESRDPEVIKAQSDAERRRALEEIASSGDYGPRWAELLDKVLPTKPVFRLWVWDATTSSFEIHLRKAIQGVVTEVGPSGIKLARGVVIALPKHLKGTLGGRITFERGFELKGKKGPVSVALAEAELVESNGRLFLRSQGKKVAFDKLLDSVKTVEWK